MKCKRIKKLTAGIIFLAAVGSLSGCQKAATAENLFRDIEVNMTSVESAEENQIVKLQMGMATVRSARRAIWISR